jgi:hypothetical protein
MRAWLVFACVLVGCGHDYDLRVTSTMTVTPVSGTGTSPLEPLVGQVISFAITFAPADRAYEPQNGCPTTIYGATVQTSATGSTAALVQSGMLDHLPYWEALISVCMPLSGSSVTLRSDNQAGLGVGFGCHDLLPSLLELDGDGHPSWSTFVENTGCDATIYDQLNGRLYAATDITMQFDAP